MYVCIQREQRINVQTKQNTVHAGGVGAWECHVEDDESAGRRFVGCEFRED